MNESLLVKSLLCPDSCGMWCDTEKADMGGWTPLMIAAQQGHSGVCPQLLTAGANRSAKNLQGHTAFTCAIEEGEVECVAVLRGLISESKPARRPYNSLGISPRLWRNMERIDRAGVDSEGVKVCARAAR